MIPETEPPICTGCDFFQYRDTPGDESRSQHECHRDREEPVTVNRNLVTGDEIIHSAGLIRSCNTERRKPMFFWLPLQFDRCGSEGKYFRAKPRRDEVMPNAGED